MAVNLKGWRGAGSTSPDNQERDDNMLRSVLKGSACLIILLSTVSLFAGGGVDLNIPVTEAAQGAAFNVVMGLTNNAGQVQGWSTGFCSSASDVTVTGATEIGTDTETMGDEGGDVGFLSISIDIGGGGVTMGVVIDLFGTVWVDIGSYTILSVDYTQDSTSSSTIDSCGTLGSPAVASVYVMDGASIPFPHASGNVTVPDPNHMTLTSASAILGSTADTTVDLENVNDVDAIQIAFTFDPAVAALTGTADLTGADFYGMQAGAAGEAVIGIILDMTSPLDHALAAGTGPIVALSWSCDTEGTSALTFTNGLGIPATDNLIVDSSGINDQINLNDGTLTVVNYNEFLRGNCNGDTTVNIADGIFEINYLFLSGPAPGCDDACDSNDDGAMDATDAIYIFNYRFLDGPMPAAPFPVAGLDPTNGDGLGCNGDADDI